MNRTLHKPVSMFTSFALLVGLMVGVAVLMAKPALADGDVGMQGNVGEECAHDAYNSATTADNAGHVYVFWTNYCSNHDRIFYQVSSDSGKTFANARSLCSAIPGCTSTATADTYATQGDVTADDPSTFVDTSTSPPTLYVTYLATPSFTNFAPNQVRLLKSTDFGNTFTSATGIPTLGSLINPVCSTSSSGIQCNPPQASAKGSNLYVAFGQAASGTTATTARRGLVVSTNGGSNWTAVACSTTNGATCTPAAGGGFNAVASYLDSAGNFWVVWSESVQATGDRNISVSRTTAGTTTTSWSANIYTLASGPTYPGNNTAQNATNYPADWFSEPPRGAIDPSNDTQYLLMQQTDNNTTAPAAPSANSVQSVLRLAQCTSSCLTPSSWSGYNLGDLKAGALNNPRVDDKDASGACGGTVALATDQCSTTSPSLVVDSNHRATISWVDDRLGNPTNCQGSALGSKAWSHACGLDTWLRTQNGSYNSTDGGFTNPSFRLNNHAPSSPASNASGFFFPYGDGGMTLNPGCFTGSTTFTTWNESINYAGGGANGGLLYVRNNQTGPSAPSLSASGNDATDQIALSWTAVAGATSYKIYRAVNGGGYNATLYQTITAPVTAYTDTAVTTNTDYSYAVTSVTGAGESCQSARSPATSHQSKFSLTTAATPTDDLTGTPTSSVIATSPAPPDLRFKKYSSLNVSATQFPPRDATSRWRFTNWTLSPSSFTDGTLSAAVSTTTATTMSVTEAAHSQEPPVPFTVKVDNEQMNVTAVSGSGPYTYTLSRGYNGTTAATHLVSAAVTFPAAKSGCTTDPTSCVIQMQSDVTATANYVKQWQVTTKVAGIRCDDPFSQVCDLPATQRLVGESGTGLANSIFGAGDMSYADANLPQLSYVDDGGTLNYRAGYKGIVKTSANVSSCANGGRAITVASTAGFNVGDTILVDGATSLMANWNGIWTIATGSGQCAFSATKIAFVDPAGTNAGTSINGTLYITDVGNAGQGANSPSGTGFVFPSYGSDDQVVDNAEGAPNTFPPDSNRQYRLLSVQAGNTGGTLSTVNAFGSISNVTQPQTIAVTYQPQHKIQFSQNGLGAGDTSGTIASVQGFGDGATTQNFTQAQLPAPASGGTFQDDSKAFQATFTTPVPSVGSPGTKRYVGTTQSFTGLKGNQSTTDFSTYANSGISEATYDSGTNTETYYCYADQGCPFVVGQTVTVSGFVSNTNNCAGCANYNGDRVITDVDDDEGSFTAAAGPTAPTLIDTINATNASLYAGVATNYTIPTVTQQYVAQFNGTLTVATDQAAVPVSNITGLQLDGWYPASTSLTAPLSVTGTDSNQYGFISWTGCDSTSGAGGQICAVNASTPKSLTAHYRAGQTITFPSISDKTYGDSDFDPGATASSGLAVTYTSIGNCSITGGSLVHIDSVGSCTVTAHQTGDANFAAAADVDQSFTIVASGQTITFPTISDKTYGDSDFDPGATASSGLAVTYTSIGNCSITGGSLVHIDDAGSCTVTVHQEGNPSYTAAPTVDRTFNIGQAGQAISFLTIPTHQFGDVDFDPGATASSGLTVTYTALGDCTITGGGLVHVSHAGSCTVTAHQDGDNDWAAAPTVNQTFTVDKGSQVINFAPLPNKLADAPDFPVSATASSSLDVNFTATGDCTVTNDLNTATVHILQAGSCTITAHQAGDGDHNAAPDMPQSFGIGIVGQTITFPPIADKTYGDPNFDPGATSDSGLTVSYSAAGDCSITGGGLVHLDHTGSCTVTAHQAGDGSYTAAPDVSRSFNIDKAGQSIGFSAIPDHTFGDADFSISASATSGLGVLFTASSDCTVTGTQNTANVHITGAGPCTITAHQSGNSNYNAATDVPQTFTINMANQTINGFGIIATHTYGDADFPLTATSSSGLLVTYTASGQCTIVLGPKVHLTGSGSCTITAHQSGNSNYNAATDVPRAFTINPHPTALKNFSVKPGKVPSGGSVTFAITATGAGFGTPVGSTVQFRVGATIIATATTNSSGRAKVTVVVSLAPGSYTVKATLLASANYASSTTGTGKTLKIT